MQNPPKLRLDDIDRAILSVLQHNGKLSNVELADKVGLSESACLRRVKILEKSGLFERFALLLDHDALGIAGDAFVRVTLEGQQRERLEAFEKKVINIEEVMECHLLSGDADYILRVICRDNTHYKRLHARLTNLPGVQRVHTSFALRTVIKKTALPLNILDQPVY